MNTVVVTGATSMIGASIIEACLSGGVSKIYGVVRPGSLKLERLPHSDRITILECDICDYRKLAELIDDECDVFYHIAWSATGVKRNDNIPEQVKNIEYTLSALEAAHRLGCRKFIGAGSQAEYGKLDLDKISPSSPVNPTQPYGIAKYAAGRLGAEAAKGYGIDFIWVRIFSVYGKYDLPTTMVSGTIRKLLRGEHTSFTPATQRWEYLNSRDAGRAFYLIGEKTEGSKVYCLGSGDAHPLREFIYTIRDIINPDAELGIGEIPYTDGTVMNLCADISSLTEDTGWKPEVSFNDGIREIVDYAKEQII